MEVFMTLLDVLAPEVSAFEKLGTVWYLAAVLGSVFLFDELDGL